MPRWLSQEEQHLWRCWISVTAALDRAIEADLVSSGLTNADYEILAHLSEAPGEAMRMTDLAASVLVTKSGLSYRVGVLEERGFVRRHEVDDDGRVVMACLTKQGRRAIEAAAPSHVETVRQWLIDHLSPRTLKSLTADLESLLASKSLTPHGERSSQQPPARSRISAAASGRQGSRRG